MTPRRLVKEKYAEIAPKTSTKKGMKTAVVEVQNDQITLQPASIGNNAPLIDLA
jgi:hypothetical protein